MKPGQILRLALAAFALGVAGRVVAQNSLTKDSPFMPAGNPDPVAAASNDTLEFTGVSVIGNKTHVYLYDKATKKGRWLAVGTEMDGYDVLAYDTRREQIVVKAGGEQKTLTLRKGTGAANGSSVAFAQPNPAMNFNVPTPPPAEFVQKVQPPPPASETAAAAPIAENPVPTPPAAGAAAAAAKPEGPPTPTTIARQEEEARMLVSDLLEIGMAQRKAYEEKQRQAAADQTAQASTPKPGG